jgi:geranylgeranyl pyrophosphate synthase
MSNSIELEIKESKNNNESLDTIKKYQNKVNIALDEYISSQFPNCIGPMIKYIIDGGKRLRSILCLIFGNIENSSQFENYHPELITDISISIELIHCLSLVIDDTPCMDNDDYRRDRESFHKKYGLIKTNLIIYYLLNKITLLFSKYNFNNIYINNILTLNLNNLIEGQCLDINLDNNQIKEFNDKYFDNKKYLEFNSFNNEYQIVLKLLPEYINPVKKDNFIKNVHLNLLKTSSLFCLSLLAPISINHNLNNSQVNILRTWANLFGIVFQYSDDILDIEQDSKNNNPNITFIIGKIDTIKLIHNILSYLRDNILVILDTLKISSPEKISVINEILNVIEKRCKWK